MSPIRRLLDAFHERTRIKLFSLDPRTPPPLFSDTGVVKVVDPFSDGPLHAAMLEARHWDGQEMERRKRLGDACYAALDGGRCVHYSWVSSRVIRISEIAYEAVLDAGSRWIFNSYTSPSHRGRGIFPRVLGRILADLAGEGGVIAWAGVLDTNAPSLRGLSKAGFSEVLALERESFLSGLFVRRRSEPVDGLPAGRFASMAAGWARS